MFFEWERSSCVGAARKVSPDIMVVEVILSIVSNLVFNKVDEILALEHAVF